AVNFGGFLSHLNRRSPGRTRPAPLPRLFRSHTRLPYQARSPGSLCEVACCAPQGSALGRLGPEVSLGDAEGHGDRELGPEHEGPQTTKNKALIQEALDLARTEPPLGANEK